MRADRLDKVPGLQRRLGIDDRGELGPFKATGGKGEGRGYDGGKGTGMITL